MNGYAQGVFQDLRERKLLPVAVLLLVALIALPVFMLKKAPAVPAGTSTVTNATPAAAAGLPTPQQVLSSDKPLVSLAVLEDPSNLNTFKERNPFKPLQKLASSSSDSSKGSGTAAGSDSSPSDSSGSGSSGSGSSGGSSEGTGGSGGTGGGSTGGGGTDTTPTTPTQPSQPEKQLSYVADLSFRTAKTTRQLRGVQKTQLIPSQSNPLLVFLGVDATGNKAVFLVDSTLSVAAGEGTCKTSDDDCATLSLEPGQLEVFKDDKGNRYELQIDQIRTVSTASLAKSAKAAERRQARSAHTADSPTRRFIPPVITDLLVGGQR